MVERENWIETDIETGTKDWYDPNLVHDQMTKSAWRSFGLGSPKYKSSFRRRQSCCNAIRYDFL